MDIPTLVAAPTQLEANTISSCAGELADLLRGVSAGPFSVGVEAMTSTMAREVAAACQKQLSTWPHFLIQPWRYKSLPGDIRLATAAHVLRQVLDFAEKAAGGFRGLQPTSAVTTQARKLYEWLQQTSWSPVWQVEFDTIIKAWIASVNDQVLVVVEGLEECDKSDQELCRAGLSALLTDRRVRVVMDSHVGGAEVSADWPVDVAFEIPALSRSGFDELVTELLMQSRLFSQRAEAGRVAGWAKLIRASSFPRSSDARRIVNDMAIATRHAWNIARGLNNVDAADLIGSFDQPNSQAARIGFMVLLSHRFPQLADRIQTEADGPAALTRLMLAAKSDRPLEFARIRDDDHWRTFSEDQVLRKFLRAGTAGETPLVSLFGGRLSSYFWSGLGARLNTPLSPSSQSLESERSFRARLAIEAASYSTDAAAQVVADVRASGDWELMSGWAVAAAGSARSSEAATSEDLLVGLARQAVELAEEMADSGAILRSQGALAVVLARFNQRESAAEALKESFAACVDQLDMLRYNEFAALVAERHWQYDEAREIWDKAVTVSEQLGIQDLAARARAGQVRTEVMATLTKGSRPVASSSEPTIFISYRHADGAVVDLVHGHLRRQLGTSVFFDKESLRGGTLWLGSLLENLQRARFAVLFISRAYVEACRAAANGERRDDVCYWEATTLEAVRQRGLITVLFVSTDGTTPSDQLWGVGPRITQWIWTGTKQNPLATTNAEEVAARIVKEIRHSSGSAH